MEIRVTPGNPLHGEIKLPGDKSISHRAAVLAALAQGESRFVNFLTAGVTEAMLDALKQLGVRWQRSGCELTVEGKGLLGLQEAQHEIDCGNSGTTLRLLAGALTAANLTAVLDGTEGLRKRPMRRIVEPLREMGALIESSSAGTAPLRLQTRHGNHHLHGDQFELPVASAQVKSAVLLAGLAADSAVAVVEPAQSRDHTERMLAAMGVHLNQQHVRRGNQVVISPLEGAKLNPLEMVIPGDFSSASFLITAALVTPGSDILIREVGLNPTRTGFLDVLCKMGAEIQILRQAKMSHELRGDIRVRFSKLNGVRVTGKQVVRMIDEFPILAAAAAYAEGETEISQAEELRYKESDRISAICTSWQALGITVEERRDGFLIRGGRRPLGGTVDPVGDHRLAMASVVCGLGAEDSIVVKQADIFKESYPGFMEDLQELGADITDE